MEETKNKRPTVGAAIIAKNESACIRKMLESLKGVDEIVVVDTGSEDNTMEIAREFTDRVYDDFKWCDNFSAARNHVKAKLATDWIISVDCDEYLHDFSKVQEAVQIAEECGALAVDVALVAEDNGQTHMFPRLFKNFPTVWWEGAIHNHLSVLGHSIGDVKITFGYSPAHHKDPNRAFRILSKEVERRPDAVRETFYLGREYWYRRDYENCVKTMGNYVQRSSYLAEKADAFLIMSRCYWEMKMGEDARDACLQALKINSHFKEAVLFMSEIVWPQYAEPWKKMAEASTNEGVLFKRA